jgi:hypothetical protein
MRVVKEYILSWTKESIQRGKLNQLLKRLQHAFRNEIESIELLFCISADIAISPQSRLLSTIEELAIVIAPESSDADADKHIDSGTEAAIAVEKLAPLLALLVEQLIEGIDERLQGNAFICADETLVLKAGVLHTSVGHIIFQAVSNAVYARQNQPVIPVRTTRT